jgi:hypothetical protein
MSNDRDDPRGPHDAPPPERPAEPGSAGPQPEPPSPTGSSTWEQPAGPEDPHGQRPASGQAADPQTQPYGYGPAHGSSAPAPNQQYGDGQQYRGAQQYGQAPYGPAQQYGQPSPGYGQQPSGYGTAAQYGQPYGEPGAQYGLSGGYGPYGQPAIPARPGAVITSAVLGFVFAALGLLVAVACIAGGALVDDLIAAIEASDPTVGGSVNAAEITTTRVALLVTGLLALAWTVVMIWGSALAVRGRSRVLLLVGASITVASTGLVLLLAVLGAATTPDEPGQGGAIVLFLVVFLAALAMLVLLCLRPASAFFAAHRAARARRG